MKAACDLTSSPVERSKAHRLGAMMLETQIALALLGIGLAGLSPFVVMQLRQLKTLESRLVASTYTYKSVGMASHTVTSNKSYYLVPWNNPWTRKLTMRCQLQVPTDGTTTPSSSDTVKAIPSPTCVTLYQPPGQPQPFLLNYDANGNPTATVTVQVQ
jgi:hypothetical protein